MARRIGAKPRGQRMQKGRILSQHLICFLPVADPEVVKILRIPFQCLFASGNRQRGRIFPPGIYHGNQHGPKRSVLELKQDDRLVLGIDRDLLVFLIRSGGCKGEDLPCRLFADRVYGAELCVHPFDPHAADKFGQIHPVGTDIRDSPGLAHLAFVQTPAVIGLVQKPILNVLTMHGENLAQFPAADHLAHLVGHRIQAVVKIHGTLHALFVRQGDQLLRLLHRRGKRLFTYKVYAVSDCILCDLVMRKVRCTDVNCIEITAVDHFPVIRKNLFDPELGCLLFCPVGVAESYDSDFSESPDCLNVNSPDKSGADHGCYYFLHRSSPPAYHSCVFSNCCCMVFPGSTMTSILFPSGQTIQTISQPSRPIFPLALPSIGSCTSFMKGCGQQ